MSSSSSCSSSPISSSPLSSSSFLKKKISAKFRNNNSIEEKPSVYNKYYEDCIEELNTIYKNNPVTKKDTTLKQISLIQNVDINGKHIINLDENGNIKTYETKKIGDGKSGALVYKIQQLHNNSIEKQLLKIYVEQKNSERNIREISIYCTFEKIKNEENNKNDLSFFPKLIEKGFIKKKSKTYPGCPYIITELVQGISLYKILKHNKCYTDKDLFFKIMMKILNSLLYINRIIAFSHEDLHPGNIIINIDTKNELKDVKIIDFDLAEMGTMSYKQNINNPVTRPYSRRISNCVPGVLNKLIEKVFKKDKDVYNKFLKNFNQCSLIRSVFKSDKDFNKIKLDRVVIVYYLFIFGYILKDKIIVDLETKKDKIIVDLETKKDKLTKKHEIDNIDNEIKKINDYPQYFFDYYITLTNNISSDSITNILFYEDAIAKFEYMYKNTTYFDNLKNIYKEKNEN